MVRKALMAIRVKGRHEARDAKGCTGIHPRSACLHSGPPSRQRAAELMMAAVEDGEGLEDATKQIELALFLEARYLPAAQPART
jgi:hypothetical protein